MRKADHIVLLDPALQNNEGTLSSNLGDLIISESIVELLGSIFPGKEIKRISSHSFLNRDHRKLINSAAFSFIGGTNLLYSDMLTYRQIGLRKGKLLWLFPGTHEFILIGAGWGPDYEKKLTWRTAILYNNLLHKDFNHSVRDHFTKNKLENETKQKAINTSCTTMWKLDGINSNLTGRSAGCLFSLTDYRKDQINDEGLIRLLLDQFDSLTYFPQGKGDLEYLESFDVYKRNKEKIHVLPHDYRVFKDFIFSQSFVYIGTRLHGGIKCMEASKKAMILAVDNRAKEIAKDTNLPVIERTETGLVKKWLANEEIFSNPIAIPAAQIAEWKKQFN